MEEGKAPAAPAPVASFTSYLSSCLHALFLENWYFSILHVFFPLALWFQFCAEQNDINGMLLFFFALLALVPQAERMGYVTEQLCLHVGEVAAGLINVSMGNLPELIVVIFALAQNTPDLAEESLVGGVMSNMLLVTGLALFAGGLRHKIQSFNVQYTQPLLLIVVLMGLIISLISQMPVREVLMFQRRNVTMNVTTDAEASLTLNLTSATHQKNSTWETSTHLFQVLDTKPMLDISRVVSMFALAAYVLFLVFALKTHRSTLAEGGADDNDDDEEEEDVLGLKGALFTLAVLTGTVSLLCDGIVRSIESAARATHLSELFITAIILPNVNNAPEHAVAIRFAYKGRVDAAMACSIGSAAQLAAFVLPLGVLISWVTGGEFDLRLPPVEMLALTGSSLFTAIALVSGRSTWLTGATLLLTYLTVAATWYFQPLAPDDESKVLFDEMPPPDFRLGPASHHSTHRPVVDGDSVWEIVSSMPTGGNVHIRDHAAPALVPLRLGPHY